MLRSVLACLGLCFLAACSALQPDLDPPRISIEGFRNLPGEGHGPRFEVDLRIQNPNRQALDIAGIAYDIALQDVELVSGVTDQVPVVEGYTEERVTLESRLDTLRLVRFIAELGSGGTVSLDRLEYRVVVKVDFNGPLPTQRIVETGVIGESGGQRR